MTQSIETLLAVSPAHHLRVTTYSVSHGRWMTLALRPNAAGAAPIVMVADECRYLRGALNGGPYRLKLDTSTSLMLRLYDEDGQFELTCRRLRLEEAP